MLLEVQHLKKNYRELVALDELSLSIDSGQVVGIIGPNGSGKTTFLRLISGQEVPTQGRVFFQNHDVTRMATWDRIRLGMGIKRQITSVFRSLTVYENVLLACSSRQGLAALARGRTDEADARVDHLLGIVGLRPRAYHIAGTLSHGEQQWLELALAFANEPSLVLLDEPLAGMGPEERGKTEGMIRALAGDATVILIEHDLDFVRRFCQLVVVLYNGRLVAQGSPEDVQQSEAVRNLYLAREWST